MSSVLHARSFAEPVCWGRFARRLGGQRSYSDYIRYPATEGRTIKVPLKNQKLIGVSVSRGTRRYQEDAHSIAALQLPWQELSRGLHRNFGLSWHPQQRDWEMANQVLYVGVYDGHGGAAVSEYLRDHLHTLVENAHPSQIPEVVQWLKSYGGYFRRFRGGVLEDWLKDPTLERPLDMESRVTLAFLQADYEAAQLPQSKGAGTTASVAILHPLELPTAPFFSSEAMALTVAHCGDTRVLLCSTETGSAFPMTEDHHADTRLESARLRKLGTGLVTDSFGEARWMGAVANTRGLGDAEFKPVGVTPEPEVKRRVLKGKDWAFLAFVSDGITSVVSNDEIVDLARNAKDPSTAAKNILSYAEMLGSEDNATVIVVPLAGWGMIRGPDRTYEIRMHRKKQAEGSERQRRM
ncbi:protein serine/threonine phosphatase 2C [Clavulina sp. PMI_390]|nr:protein serine/threonine phosphatase 2C [Clavulina sp. PMI_390]